MGWENSAKNGMDSEGHKVKREIYNGRMPTLLTDDKVGEWMNPKMGADRAIDMVRQYPEDKIELAEVPKQPKLPKNEELPQGD